VIELPEPVHRAIEVLRATGAEIALGAVADGRVEVTATSGHLAEANLPTGFLPLDADRPHRTFATWIQQSGTWLILRIIDPTPGATTPRATASPALSGRGIVLAVLGPDGAGKTSALSGLAAAYVRPMRIAKLRLRSIRGPWPISWLGEAIRIVSLGIATRIARRRGQIIAWDRHPAEDRLPAPMRRVVDRRWRWLAPIIPDPDVVVVLDAPVEVLMGRRPDEDPIALEQIRSRYRAWAGENPSVHLVDATAPHADVIRAMTAVVWAAEAAEAAAIG
jgi:thymidylate kinase